MLFIWLLLCFLQEILKSIRLFILIFLCFGILILLQLIFWKFLRNSRCLGIRIIRFIKNVYIIINKICIVILVIIIIFVIVIVIVILIWLWKLAFKLIFFCDIRIIIFIFISTNLFFWITKFRFCLLVFLYSCFVFSCFTVWFELFLLLKYIFVLDINKINEKELPLVLKNYR